jgi:hypothetical protein
MKKVQIRYVKQHQGWATLLTKAMTSSQPEAATDKNNPTKQAKKMIMRMISMSRLRHPSLRTCQGVLSVLTVCGFLMAATLPQCHRILLETLPTTPATMTPITNPKSSGSILSTIQAPFSEVKRDFVSHDRPTQVQQLLDNFPRRCYNNTRTNVLIQNQEKDGLWMC